MPITGGVFTPLWQWVVDSISNPTMQPARFDLYGNDVATALNTAVFKDGSNLPIANLPMAGFRHTGVGDATVRTSYASAGQVQDGKIVTATDTGSANTYVIAPTPALTAYAAGQIFWIKPATTNTGSSTLNVSGLGAKSIKTVDTTDVIAGDITAGRVYSMYYDGTNFILSTGSSGGSFVDSQFRVLGSSDATKKVALEVDGLTTSTTRTLTVQDVSGTIYVSGGADVAIADGGTGASTALAGFDALKQASTTTYTGVVELATDAETKAGTDTVRAITPSNLRGSIGISSYASLPDQTVTTGVATVIPHGLGFTPKMVFLGLKNVTAEAGWTPGNIASASTLAVNGGAQYGMQYEVDSVNVYLYQAASQLVLNKAGTGLATITPARWLVTVSVFG